MIAEAALVTLLQSGPSNRLEQPKPRFSNNATGGSETPLPEGVFPTLLVDQGTVQTIASARDAGDMAREARRYAQALAVIPIDPAADQEIDRLLSSRVEGIRAKRPLPRKR